MSDTRTAKLPRWSDWGVMLAVFMISIFGANALARSGTRAGIVAASLAIAVGTAGCAALASRFSRYPRWAFATSVAVLAVFALGSAALSPDPARWARALSGTLWMHPWYFLVATTFATNGSPGVCGSGRAGGWFLVGGAAFLGLVVPVVSILV